MIICCKNTLMKTKNDNNFMNILIHYPDNIKIENIIKEAIKIDSIINPDNRFDIDMNKKEEKIKESKYVELERKIDDNKNNIF